MVRHARTRRALIPVPLALLVFAACGEHSTAPEDRIVAGVNLTQLFAPPSQTEIDAILAEWSTRDVSARSVQVLHESAVTVGTDTARLRVISHAVSGVTHFGGSLVPDGASPGSLPVLVFAHGGDHGVDIDELLPALPLLLGDDLGKFAFAAPSFRGETLEAAGMTYTSEGPPSIWDRDVDDALAFLNVVAATTPEADIERVGVLGFSRGAAVALLMAERDPRIDLVVEFFGPTDFFGPFVQEVVEEALLGQPRDLPGMDQLDRDFLQPLRRGELTIADVRPEILRRSAVYFADRLPQVQVHHGMADETVPVGEAERLIEVMQALGREAPGFEFFLYEGGIHDPFSLTGSIPRARDFLGRLLSPALSSR